MMFAFIYVIVVLWHLFVNVNATYLKQSQTNTVMRAVRVFVIALSAL